LDSIKLAEDCTQLLVAVNVALDLLIRPPTNALDKIQFMTSIKLLHVSASGCPLQGVFLRQRNTSLYSFVIIKLVSYVLLSAFAG
jgi:hypothetical protein